MKIYQVSYGDCIEGHRGYSYYSSRAKAVKAINDFKRKGENFQASLLDESDVEISKAGILEALNRYAGYPDNG